MVLGAFGAARWGAVNVNAEAPEGVAPPCDVGAPDVERNDDCDETGVSEYRIGIDAGSKTIKMVVIDAKGNNVYSLYHRHRSDILTTLADIVHELAWKHGDIEAPVCFTGSAGIGVAEALGMPFVQEVVATTQAVRERIPQADCVIELGGEDAKIIYLTGGLEQRMNATCAGGTGDFIDGIANMLDVRTRDFSKLAFSAQRTYPIASRCAVFAQTDVRPLLAAGAAKSDIALSALKAVVKQTIGGLACGRPIRGTVVFLGGPLNYIPALEREFRLALGLTRQTGIRPRDAHLYTAAGAAMSASGACAVSLSDLERRVRACPNIADDLGHLPPLFENEEERAAFFNRHEAESVRQATGDAWKKTTTTAVQGDVESGSEPVFLGFDAGSTSVKYAIVDASGGLITWDYQLVEGDTLAVARRMLERALSSVKSAKSAGLDRHIAHASVTGYGEDLMRAAFGFDSGVVETVAHLRAAREFRPDVSFVLDIGGQDMKALWVRDGAVVDAVLNESCSSGCGAFVHSNASTLEMSDATFSKEAMEARRPIDLGAKCTVFMTSRVRHAQKIGASRGDIAAGVAYSVVNNALTRIIGSARVASMGDAVVVQGGTFKSDAVLRAFEKVTGVHATRPKEAHLMGAYGAALVARDRYFEASGGSDGGQSSPVDGSSIITLDQLRAFDPKRKAMRCSGCGNACLLSAVEFGDGRRFISGNKCERAYSAMFGSAVEPRATAPNAVAYEQRTIAQFGDVASDHPRGCVTVGLPRALNTYENTSFWHTLFASLGFSIVVADDDAAQHLVEKAAETIPSESVCYPAKRVHLRYEYLMERGADYVFLPCSDRGMRCPVATNYASALADNVAEGTLLSPQLRSIGPRGLRKRPYDCDVLYEAVAAIVPAGAPLSREEFDWALGRAFSNQDACDSYIAEATRKTLGWLAGDPSRRGVILVGRPYHLDPALSLDVDKELNRLGFAVVSPAGLAEVLLTRDPTSIRWMATRHLAQSLEFAAFHPQLEVVALRSFGCGFDAVAFDEADDLSKRLNQPFTALKVDDIADRAHMRIRLRTMAEASSAKGGSADVGIGRPIGSVTPDLCSTAKELCNRTLAALEGREPPYTLEVPVICKECLTDALPFELLHVNGYAPTVASETVKGEVLLDGAARMKMAHGATQAMLFPRPFIMPDVLSPDERGLEEEALAECVSRAKAEGKPAIGIVGNPLLVFDERMNEGVVALVERLGCRAVLPDRHWLEVDDVRYRWQLEAFHRAGVDRVIYLQSFGCLKGHVQSRGALREFARLYPGMPVTVIDYDSESSALNRENRVRLAVEAAWQACKPKA